MNTVSADHLAGLPEEEDSVWRRDVELETLRPVLDELGEELQDRSRHLETKLWSKFTRPKKKFDALEQNT